MSRYSLLFLVILFSACSPKEEEKETFEEQLIYLKSKDGNFDLYTSDVLGKWEERFTDNPGWDWAPHWISGLNEVAYYTNDTARNFSWVKRGINETTVDTLPNADLLNLKLSPKGEYIYYIFEDDTARNIARQPIAGGERELMTFTTNYNGRFSLDKQETKMAFISDRNGDNQLYLMELATKEVKQLTDGSLIAKYNSFSPDGKQIAVTLAEPSDDPLWDIYIIDIETGERRQLTDTPYSEQEISWSLSGEKIAFHGTTEADGDHIYTIDIADGKFTKITSGDYYHGEPAWIPSK